MSLDLFISKLEKAGVVQSRAQNIGRQVGQSFRLPLKIQSASTNGNFDYTLGQRHNNVRFIDVDSVATMNRGPHSNLRAIIEDKFAPVDVRLRRQYRLYNMMNTSDGYIGITSQGEKRGNCYFLASINSIRATRHGQKLLNSNIKKNNDNSITITLPGAKKVRNKYLSAKRPCEVTGTYHISRQALIKAAKNAGLTYSEGDLEVIAYELAMESYRAELVKTKELNPGGMLSHGLGSPEAEIENILESNDGDFLSSGKTYDAMYLLSGEKSDVYNAHDSKIKKIGRYKEYEFGKITIEEMERRTANESPSFLSQYSLWFAQGRGDEISSYVRSETGLSMLLNKCQGRESDYAITCSVKVQKGSGATKNDGNHALSVLKITDDVVYVSNPWHPDEIEPIPRKKFEKMVYRVTATPIGAA